MKPVFKRLFKGIAAIGADPLDDPETRLPKSILVLSSIPFMIAGTVWGCMYIAFGERYAGLIPLGYAAFSSCSLIYYHFSRHYSFFRFSQLFLILMLPFTLMTALGGFIQGSAVILWGLISPLGALLFDNPSRTPRWFMAYGATLVLSAILQPMLNLSCALSDAQIQLFFVINFLGVGSLVFLMFYYFVRQKQFFQQRTEELLLNILPKETAAELKETGTTRGHYFDHVTVLFTDFVNFTAISELLSPQDLVNEIHNCYSQFDTIITRYGVEKIKTIGDSYMCASGLPVAKVTHAIDAIHAALDILDFIEAEKQTSVAKGLPNLEVRIGLHSGPVVAGIVGLKKFAYDIWGDTVNMASRMESSGIPNTINLSASTYHLVKDIAGLRFTPRGLVKAKGKGEVEMWFVTRE